MKAFCLVPLLIVLTISQRLKAESQDCDIYLQKLQNLQIQETANIDSITNSVTIDLTYYDTKFNDSQYFGLVPGEGKTLESTCLDLILLHTSQDYSLISYTWTPVSSSNATTQKRKISFSMNITDLYTSLLETSTTVLSGIFLYQFILSETSQVAKAYQFELTISLDQPRGQMLQASLKPLTYYTNVKFCSDFTCSSYIDPNIHINDNFVVELTSQDSTAQFNEVSVQYVAEGLLKSTTIIESDFTKLGQARLILKATIQWTGLRILFQTKITINSKTKWLQLISKEIQFKGLTSSNLNIYSDLSCSISAGSFYFEQYLILREQSIQNVTNVNIYLVGNNYNQTVNIVYAEFNNSGMSKYLVNIDHIGNNLYFLVEKTTINDTITSKSENLTCIRRSYDSEQCPTCLEQCEINGFNEEGCESCDNLYSSSEMMIGRVFALILLISF